jgi:hypothetical protein
VALLSVFIAHERTTTRDPLIRLGLFTTRAVAAANACSFILGAVLASSFYFMSLYLQRVLGTGPALTGIEFLPFALGVIAGAAATVRLGYRIAPRTLLVGGGLLTAAGFAWFGTLSPEGTYIADILGPSIVAGIGFGLCLGPVVATATAGVAAHESGAASGLLNSSRWVGVSLGLAALGTAAAHRTGHSARPQALTDGYALGMTLSAALMAAAVLIALFVLPKGKMTALSG